MCSSFFSVHPDEKKTSAIKRWQRSCDFGGPGSLRSVLTWLTPRLSSGRYSPLECYIVLNTAKFWGVPTLDESGSYVLVDLLALLVDFDRLHNGHLLKPHGDGLGVLLADDALHLRLEGEFSPAFANGA